MSKPYIPYLNFGQSAVCLICEVIIFNLYAKLLYISIFKPKLLVIGQISKSMRFYFVISIFYSLSSCVNHFYAVFWWRPGVEDSYNPAILFCVGVTSVSFAVLPPIAVFFMTVDRCFALNFPNNSRLNSYAFQLGIFIVILAFFINLTFIVSELPLRFHKLTKCVSFGCLMTKYNLNSHLVTKMLFSTLNLIFGVISSTS
uniref:7TM GPCR serpentine receptor class x (Srx) domain-containing protein n=1 Tax=Ditylenchus dipsaci TaxID=166011 RepID=A0A915DKV3_9BILA